MSLQFCKLLQGIYSYKNLQIQKHYFEEFLKLLQSWEETLELEDQIKPRTNKQHAPNITK
jgi:hypothetical protein